MYKLFVHIPYIYTVTFSVLIFLSRFFRYKSELDLCFVSESEGWALDRICKEIQKEFTGTSTLHRDLSNLPPAEMYFYSHYRKFILSILKNPRIAAAKHYVFFTHYSGSYMSDKELGRVLNYAEKIFTMNTRDVELLKSFGVKEEKLVVAYAGVDENIFKSIVPFSERRAVGFCLKYYGNDKGYESRKNDNIVIDLILSIEAPVILVGKKWQNSSRWNELQQKEGFSYFDIPYDEYVAQYNKMRVFVSASKLEGGPLPLLEAMSCGCIPVVSDTGFAPDMIEDGVNGYLFNAHTATIEDIKSLIERAYAEENNQIVVDSIKDRTWKNFAKMTIMQMTK